MVLSMSVVLLSGSQFRDLKLLYVQQYFPELSLVGTATAEPEASVSVQQYFPELSLVGTATAEPEASVSG